MYPYHALKNMYLSIFFYLLYDEKEKGAKSSFGVIVWTTRIVWTILLPLLVTFIIFKIVKRVITNKDIEDALNESKKHLAIYSELSEFEWRSPLTVLFRLCEKMSRGAEDGAVLGIPSLKNIYGILILGTNILWKMRQETKEEYVARYSFHLLQDPKKSEEAQLLYAEKYSKTVTENFEKQFDLIVQHGKSDSFKEFYLGRDFLFLKINIGKPKKITPKELALRKSH